MKLKWIRDYGSKKLIYGSVLKMAIILCRVYAWLMSPQGYTVSTLLALNTLRPRRNEQHFADDIFKRIFFNENDWISIKISLKVVPKGPIKNIPVLVQIMAWCRSGNKPLSESMMVSLPTHICVTRPQWVNEPVVTSGFPSQRASNVESISIS